MTSTLPVDDRDRVGPYRAIAAIGAGGSARIDLARLERVYGFERYVVIKRPLEHLRGDPTVAASLRQEARLGGRLCHPNLVAVLDAGTHDGYDYLVLEYVHGAPLRRVMQTAAADRVRALPLGVVLGIAIDVARGLHHAHELTDAGTAPCDGAAGASVPMAGRSGVRAGALGLVHRDVSPGNVLVGVDGAVKLADFGIAKETQVSTLSGTMRGTVTYMAPEQCQGHPFDRRADVFSLGVILFELVTHHRLFHADNDVASLHRVLSGVIPRPRDLNPDVPRELEDIVLTAVAFDAAKRFATAGELGAALEGVAARRQLPIGARWIARAVEQVLGRPAEPWRVRAPAAVPPGLDEEGSLLALIETLDQDDDDPTVVDEPLWPTFGPPDDGPPVDVDAVIGAGAVGVVAPRRRGRAVAIATIAGAMIAAAGITVAVAVGRNRDRIEAPVPTERTLADPSPSPSPISGPDSGSGSGSTPELAAGSAAVSEAPEPAAGSAAVSEAPDTSRRRRRRDDRASTPPAPGSGSSAAAGSAKAAPPPPANEPTETPTWHPDLFLPGDGERRGSGSGR